MASSDNVLARGIPGSGSENVTKSTAQVVTISRLMLKRFSIFSDLDITFSSGVNVFIGENSTGKTHIMKALYCALSSSQEAEFEESLLDSFLPADRSLGRLAKRTKGSSSACIHVERGNSSIDIQFSNHATSERASAKIKAIDWNASAKRTVFIPVRESLSNSPGFRSLFLQREIFAEKIQFDLINSAFLPPLKGKPDSARADLLKTLEAAISGRVITKGEMFYLNNEQGELEFSLLSEGIRKLALVWLLIQNGVLQQQSTLFWDEPEANQNPNRMEGVASLLLCLARMGIQVFVASHNYLFLRELELQSQSEGELKFFSLLKKADDSSITVASGHRISELGDNPIVQSYLNLADKEIEISLGS